MKYTIIYDNNVYQSNNKYWRKHLRDTGAQRITIIENATGERIIEAENYCGKYIKSKNIKNY